MKKRKKKGEEGQNYAYLIKLKSCIYGSNITRIFYARIFAKSFRSGYFIPNPRKIVSIALRND